LCSNTDTVTLIVLQLPIVTASNDTTICEGDSAFLSAAGGANYVWTPSLSLNNPTISNPIATPTSTTTYSVTITGINGCINTDSVKVSVNTLPNIDAGTNTVLCPGDSVPLSASGGINYVWSPSAGLSNSTISNPNANPSTATTYYVTGTDVNGCSNTDSVLVSIGTIPTANFGYNLSLACEGMLAQFSDSSLNATGWSWNFGEGNSSSLQNPQNNFSYGSSYVITLIVINPPCKDTAQKTISVSDLSSYVSFQTSTVFTPNADGMNDCFHLIPNISGVDGGKFAGCAELTVYDRWGVPVYHSAYSGACWDGKTSTGIDVSEGTYFWIFDLNGIQEKGFITVLR
jgi:gliding motility-associated-like protein